MDSSLHINSSKLVSLLAQGAISLEVYNRLNGKSHLDLLTQGNNRVLAVFNTWSKTGDDHQLESDLIEITTRSHRYGALSPLAVQRWVPEEEEEGSSPLGAFLHEKKKHQHAYLELKIRLCGTEAMNQDQSSSAAKS